ncbi:probable proline iminopeptidase [Sycon ciliatum]|uniref:probable proline iminopeptidase n=1 Tax=Sycon ciliatum TaxID=27933 RepID=UPI0020A8E2D0|eukprot:scpid50867/ scgid9387/ Proline iminopeptidase; Prolyl aminopeptidase
MDSDSRHSYYKQPHPHDSGMLQVSDLHSVYYDVGGNPNGKPVLIIHGGPGSGSHVENRAHFDPAVFRIVMTDQRGAGKSTPWAELRENDTWSLVKDMETLREHLNIDKWMLFGGSWGSTLALAYAITHPDRVTSMVLRGVFTCRPSEIRWFYQHGASEVFPDYWKTYADMLPEGERSDVVSAYHRRLCMPIHSEDGKTKIISDEDLQEMARYARAWAAWECATSRLHISEKAISKADNSTFSVAFARIESHYFVNKGFFSSDNYIIDNVHRIEHIPCTIVQGRYDMVCPVRTAYDLHRNWPGSKLVIVPDGAHSRSEPGMKQELLEAVAEFS